MPNPNAIVSISVRLDPSLDRPPADLLRAEGGLSVELEGARRALLDPEDSRSEGFARILDGLSKQRLPVYLEVDAATSAITRLLIPLVARVLGISPTEEDALTVELEPSHARHILQLGQPDSADIEGQLREALQSGQPVILTEDDAHRIIDVRAFTPGPEGPMPPFPPPSPFPRPRPSPHSPRPLEWIWDLLRRIWWWPWWPWWWFRCLSMERAQQIFNAMSATSCAPLTATAPCISFLYPDDGCWARAHEMCRLMINMGFSPEKVWIEASTRLHVNTRNNPACFVDWGWHVAPTLCVRGPRFFQVERMVIDPSLFTAPVSITTWKGVQGDPNASLTDTAASIYWLWGSGTDPTYSKTNYYLGYYRLQLLTRAINQGPPPYANCP